MTVPHTRPRALLLLALSLIAVCLLVLPQPAPAGTAGMTTAEEQMFDALNGVRERRGLRPLRAHTRLTRAAGAYANVMMRDQRWAHSGSLLIPGFHRVGEILGRITDPAPTTAPMVRAWLESPAHRRLVLDGRFRHVGVATVAGRFGGQKSRLWVVRFGG